MVGFNCPRCKALLARPDEGDRVECAGCGAVIRLKAKAGNAEAGDPELSASESPSESTEGSDTFSVRGARVINRIADATPGLLGGVFRGLALAVVIIAGLVLLLGTVSSALSGFTTHDPMVALNSLCFLGGVVAVVALLRMLNSLFGALSR